VVRVTGSGMGCPDWPLCHGRWIPPFELAAWIEYLHRLLAAVITPLVVATAVLAWRRRGDGRHLFGPAAAAVVLLVVQIALGAVTVFTANRGDTVVAHLLVALSLLAMTVVVATRAVWRPATDAWPDRPAGAPGATVPAASPGSHRARHAPELGAPPQHESGARRGRSFKGVLVGGLVGLTLALALVGAATQVAHGGFACPDFPLCGGALWPAERGWPAQVHMLHRALALAVGLLLLGAARTIRREPSRSRRRLATAALLLYVAQVAVGVAMVWLGMPTSWRAAHVAVAAALWAAVVALATLLWEQPGAVAGRESP
jgi:heme A synthase